MSCTTNKERVYAPSRMRFEVHHFSRYEYSTPVGLGTHLLRLLPQGPTLRVVRRHLDIFPVPVRETELVDAHGNEVLQVEFVESTSRLEIHSRFEVFTAALPLPPSGSWAPLPWQVPPSSEDDGALELATFTSGVLAHSTGDALGFLDVLSRTLFERTDRQVRWEGHAQTPIQTLRQRRGACRDLTLLFMECCRLVGISARFVSGYQAAADTPDGQRHLHGWPEVQLPGAGWFGWDPTHGLRVADGHVRLCAAPTQLETMPVEGGYTFVGAELTSTLSYGVRIDTTG